MNNLVKIFFPIALIQVFLFSCASAPPPVPVTTGATALPEEPPVYSLSFIAAGDNIIHATMLRASLKDGVYNFLPLYTEVKGIVSQADIAFINQETVMAGARLGYSGYPRFNTPSSLAAALADTGFTVVNQATNHVMDMGEAGITATIDTWKAIPGISIIGISLTKEKNPLVITRNNISLGFLSFTYGTNGLGLPKDKPWMVSLINKDAMAAEIKALRPLCDFLIVSLHWGTEYSHDPTAAQTALAAFLAEQGVDVVIGHHPHVLERVEYLPRPDGKQMLCFYSLGNFMSNQDRKETVLGALAYFVFHKKADELYISDTGIIPVITHMESGYTNTKVYPLYAYSGELMKKHRLHGKDKDFSMEFYNTYLAALNTKIYMYDPFEGKPHDNP